MGNQNFVLKKLRANYKVLFKIPFPENFQKIFKGTFFTTFLQNCVLLIKNLKVVPATFLLVCFLCLKERTRETRKNVFCFTSKALFVLEIIKF